MPPSLLLLQAVGQGINGDGRVAPVMIPMLSSMRHAQPLQKAHLPLLLAARQQWDCGQYRGLGKSLGPLEAADNGRDL